MDPYLVSGRAGEEASSCRVTCNVSQTALREVPPCHPDRPTLVTQDKVRVLLASQGGMIHWLMAFFRYAREKEACSSIRFNESREAGNSHPIAEAAAPTPGTTCRCSS